ncbi:glyoxalase/bleomycin resistance protein/dioxygenase [Fimbriimonas ginsengisoli Gsoil 348]|uniref:Glyoxalase/bleomycin resistance protein/dioxygenase n=2 Tax=Fimbriimonas ginsengisoli TaxID=1005039 RepID=A0A068NSW8_FIMGI|nr:glyoxalase/bleomycin resistance protein/dioxygenase [Fimbriimonas ginsengisoli Gsoil 348]
MIGLTVHDMAESIRFYRTLGLDIPDPDGGPYHDVTLEGGIRLSWNSVEMMREIEPDWKEPTGQRMTLAFLCESSAQVDTRHQALVDAGFTSHKAPWDAFWGQHYAQVLDPDGNIVDLFSPIEPQPL